MHLRIYLDDLREAPEGWERTHSAAETIFLLEHATEPVVELSLDHDLGICRSCREEGFTLAALYGCEHVGNGNDVLVWVEEQVFTDPDYIPPRITVHSGNPVARQKMEQGIVHIHKELERRLQALEER